jgi:pimeloyl-ACP methyl ester carboxylesterase
MESPRVRVPATVVWGEADRMLHPLQAEGVRAYAERVEVRRLPGVSHWVPEDCPDAIVQAVVDGDRDR